MNLVEKQKLVFPDFYQFKNVLHLSLLSGFASVVVDWRHWESVKPPESSKEGHVVFSAALAFLAGFTARSSKTPVLLERFGT